MSRHARIQGFREEFLRSYIAVVARNPLQARQVIRRRALLHTGKHLILAFGKPIEIVHAIDKQNLVTQSFWKRRFHAKIEGTPTQRKVAVPFMIVDDRLVVKLCRPDPKAVVGVRRSEKKSAILQKSLDQLIVFRRSLPEHRLLWIGIETARQLSERSIVNKLPEMS